MNSTRPRSLLVVAILAGFILIGLILRLSLYPRSSSINMSHSGKLKPENSDIDSHPEGVALIEPNSSRLSCSFRISPSDITLTGPGDGCQVLVTRIGQGGTEEDITRSSIIRLTAPALGEISSTGYVRALEAGSTELVVYHDGNEVTVPVLIGTGELPVSDFALDVMPILTKAGCNAGSCHGSAQGKGGLQLSLFGYDPEADFATVTRGMEGRRIDPFQVNSSLLFGKPTMGVPHGGGLRLRPGAPETERLRRWLDAGFPWHDASRGRLERLLVEPTDRFLPTAPAEQQIRVVAEYADGTHADVTRLCLFVSNDTGIVAVEKHGLAKLLRRGQADVVVRFANKLATVRLAAPFNDALAFDYTSVPRRNFIDDQVTRRLEHMRLAVSSRSSDAEFLRRVYFDLVGHMPDMDYSREDAEVVSTFLADSDLDKRDKLVDRLLRHSDFVTFWSLKFGDLLQINSAHMGTATGSYRIWLSNHLKLDASGNSTSYAELVKALLLSKGSLKGGRPVAPATYYAAPREVGEIAEQAARRFLGLRIRCARCHDHPLDVWTQDDYYGFASFFGGVRVEAGNEPLAQEVKVVRDNSVRHLRTGETPAPKFLDGAVAELGDREDARELLVEWMLDPSNRWFSRMAANWVWAQLMGRGLVEPVDDLRETNPATHPALLELLAEHFRDSNFDLRAFIRTVCQSETYQRSSTPAAGNEQDEQFFSRALLKPLTAHQLVDAISQVTRIPNSFGQNLGKGTRAIEINDPNVRDYMLDVLGRCDRSGGCEVGALARPGSLKMAMFMIISDELNGKLTRRGSLASEMVAAARDCDPGALPALRARQIESIYKRAYCRDATAEEKEFWLEMLASAGDPAEGLEDFLWAILNSREFVMNH